ncbi:hypothetical protein D3C72_2013880 [compost metagenome]
MVVADLLDAEVEDGGKAVLCGDRLEGAPAHAGRMKHRDVIAAPLQLGLQVFHVFEAARPERGHADQRPVLVRPGAETCGADDGAAGLGKHRPANAVEAVKPARPQDHHQIGRDALGRQEVRIGNRRDDEFRHAEW